MEIDAPGSDVKPHLVTVTSENFVPQSSLEKRISNQHDVTHELAPLQCLECFTSKQLTKIFSTRRLLNKHVHDCHGQRRFKCEVCFKAFNKPSTLKYHKRIHTVNLEKHMKCSLCPKTFTTKQTLRKHLFRVHNKKTKGVQYFKCEFCAREFVEKSRFESHMINQHRVDSEFPCPVCSKTFIDPSTLEKHVAGHDKRDSFVCDLCSKEYQRRTSLKKHLKLQHGKFFNCFKCCRSFSNKEEFDEHKLGSKTSTLQLKCEICLEIFHSQCNLDIHTNSHLKEIKTKKKEEPGMKSTPNNTNHIDGNVKTTLPESTQQLPQLHTCDFCQQTFERESHFRLHRDLVHPNAIWKCNFEQCSKSFKGYSRLKNHKIKHSTSSS